MNRLVFADISAAIISAHIRGLATRATIATRLLSPSSVPLGTIFWRGSLDYVAATDYRSSILSRRRLHFVATSMYLPIQGQDQDSILITFWSHQINHDTSSISSIKLHCYSISTFFQLYFGITAGTLLYCASLYHHLSSLEMHLISSLDEYSRHQVLLLQSFLFS